MSAAHLDLEDFAAASTFIRSNTKLVAPPLVPEIVLHLAEESVPIWQKSEEELGQMNLPPPFWAFAWAGGQALARYLLDNPNFCRDKRVLDLGSGSGLAAIAAKKAGARNVIAADIDRLALAALKLNAAANKVTIEAEARDLLSAPAYATDLVLVGDVFYERQLAGRVLDFIEKAKAMGAVVLIGDPQRNYFPRDRYAILAEYGVPVTRDLEDAEIKTSSVWRA